MAYADWTKISDGTLYQLPLALPLQTNPLDGMWGVHQVLNGSSSAQGSAWCADALAGPHYDKTLFASCYVRVGQGNAIDGAGGKAGVGLRVNRTHAFSTNPRTGYVFFKSSQLGQLALFACNNGAQSRVWYRSIAAPPSPYWLPLRIELEPDGMSAETVRVYTGSGEPGAEAWTLEASVHSSSFSSSYRPVPSADSCPAFVLGEETFGRNGGQIARVRIGVVL